MPPSTSPPTAARTERFDAAPDVVVGGDPAAERARPFDLASGRPPARAVLLPGALLLVVHHIAFDGASAAVVRRDFAQALDAPLAPPDLTYEAYVAWHAASDGAALRAFWERTLRPAPDAWALPDAAPAASPPASPPESRAVALPDEGAITLHGLLAAWALALHRWTGTADAVVGVPHHGRDVHGSEHLVGYLVNVLPVRVRVDPERTLREHVAATSAALDDAVAHGMWPLLRMPSVQIQTLLVWSDGWTDEDGSGGDDLAKTAIEVLCDGRRARVRADPLLVGADDARLVASLLEQALRAWPNAPRAPSRRVPCSPRARPRASPPGQRRRRRARRSRPRRSACSRARPIRTSGTRAPCRTPGATTSASPRWPRARRTWPRAWRPPPRPGWSRCGCRGASSSSWPCSPRGGAAPPTCRSASRGRASAAPSWSTTSARRRSPRHVRSRRRRRVRLPRRLRRRRQRARLLARRARPRHAARSARLRHVHVGQHRHPQGRPDPAPQRGAPRLRHRGPLSAHGHARPLHRLHL